MAKKAMQYREARRQYANSGAQSLRPLWPPARLYPPFWFMPNLFS